MPRELAAATGGTVLQLGADGDTIAAYPAVDAGLAESVVGELRLGADWSPSPVASMSRSGPTGVVSAHRLQVGRHLHGHLALLTSMTPAPVVQLLLGHAASLICLEQEKPLRLREAQNRFNEMLVGLILDGALTGPQTAEHLRAAGLAGADANPAQAPAGICLADQGPDLAGALQLGITAARVAALRGAALVNADSMAGYTLIAQPAAKAALTALARERLGPLADSDPPGDVDPLGT